jgi:hypothetical protein
VERQRTPIRSAPGTAAVAHGAAVLGVLYAGVSAYFGAGATGLLETVGGSLERITVALKPAASAIGVLGAVPPRWLRSRTYTWVRRAAWLAATVLVVYGGVLTLIGLLVQGDVVHRSATADQTTLRWKRFSGIPGSCWGDFCWRPRWR